MLNVCGFSRTGGMRVEQIVKYSRRPWWGEPEISQIKMHLAIAIVIHSYIKIKRGCEIVKVGE